MANTIMDELKNVNYGWKDKNNNLHNEVDNSFSDNYALESPEEVIKNQIGVCFDQVELERELFEKQKIKFNTYFIVYYDGEGCPSHTFLIYEESGKYYWFKHSWYKFRGIYVYDSEIDALKDIKKNFIKDNLGNQYNPMNLCVMELVV